MLNKIENSINMHNKWGNPFTANPVMACAVDVSLKITKRCRVYQRYHPRDIRAKLKTTKMDKK